MNYKKFADASSMSKAAELENDKDRDKTVGILLEVISSEDQRTQENLRKAGFLIE